MPKDDELFGQREVQSYRQSKFTKGHERIKAAPKKTTSKKKQDGIERLPCGCPAIDSRTGLPFSFPCVHRGTKPPTHGFVYYPKMDKWRCFRCDYVLGSSLDGNMPPCPEDLL